MSNRVVVKPLIEEYMNNGRDGEIIVSQITGHITIKKGKEFNSSTKNSESLANEHLKHYEWMEENLNRLQKDLTEDGTLLDDNYDNVDLETLINQLEQKIDEINRIINPALENLKNVQPKIEKIINDGENQSNIISNLNNDFNNALGKHSEAEYNNSKLESRIEEIEKLIKYVNDKRYMLLYDLDSQRKRLDHAKSIYNQLVPLGSKDASNKDTNTYYGFVNYLSSLYKDLENSYNGTNIKVNIDITGATN